jgi:GNAT superfamily N-acetyltransferase
MADQRPFTIPCHMTGDEFTITEASEDEITNIITLIANSEGWGLCIESARAWLAADPHSFLIGRVNGEPVSYVSGVRYEGNFGFLGAYWVYPQHRRKGYGLRVFRAALAHLEGCNISLTAVAKEVHNYEKSGFVDCCEDTIFKAKVVHYVVPDADRIVEYNDSMLDAVAAYDRTVFPAPRKAVLEEFFKMPSSRVRVYIENGGILGYAVLHAIRQGHEIGPCFADTPEIARSLFITLANLLPVGASLNFFALGENTGSHDFIANFKDFEWEHVVSLRRMYTKGLPKIDSHKLWSPMSCEFG